jgi:hypothetical protein
MTASQRGMARLSTPLGTRDERQRAADRHGHDVGDSPDGEQEQTRPAASATCTRWEIQIGVAHSPRSGR